MNIILEKNKLVYKDLDSGKMITDIEVWTRTAAKLLNSSILINNRPDIQLGVNMFLDTLVIVNDMITLCMDISMKIKEQIIEIFKEYKIIIKTEARLNYRNIIIDIENCTNDDYETMANICNDIHKIVSKLCINKNNIVISKLFDSIIEITDEYGTKLLALNELKPGNKYKITFNATNMLIYNTNITGAIIGEAKIYENKCIYYWIDLNYSKDILDTIRNKKTILTIETTLRIIDNISYHFNEI